MDSACCSRAVADLETACKRMEDEYDKLVKLKTKGELSGYDEKFHGRNHAKNCATTSTLVEPKLLA